MKAIFDRYILLYLALKKVDNNEAPDRYSSLGSLLSEDIKWPDTYLLKNPDLSFAKEALEAITALTRSTRRDVASGRRETGAGGD